MRYTVLMENETGNPNKLPEGEIGGVETGKTDTELQNALMEIGKDVEKGEKSLEGFLDGEVDFGGNKIK